MLNSNRLVFPSVSEQAVKLTNCLCFFFWKFGPKRDLGRSFPAWKKKKKRKKITMLEIVLRGCIIISSKHSSKKVPFSDTRAHLIFVMWGQPWSGRRHFIPTTPKCCNPPRPICHTGKWTPGPFWTTHSALHKKHTFALFLLQTLPQIAKRKCLSSNRSCTRHFAWSVYARRLWRLHIERSEGIHYAGPNASPCMTTYKPQNLTWL